MSLNIEKINPNIGAVISGIDLNQISQHELQHLHDALLQHQVLFFRKQNLSANSQVALAQSFGPLHIHPIFPSLTQAPEIIVLDSHQQDLKDNELWHTDVTFSHTPPLGCVLQAIKIPQTGGDTFWASATAAFQALPEALKQKLRGFTATHDIRKSFPVERYGNTAEKLKQLELSFQKNPPVVHPVVCKHPVTQDEVLFVNEGFTTRINELSQEESDELLHYLFEHSVKAEFYLRWQWQAGDVAIWDNRCTQHKALFDYGDAHRIMHRATVIGGVPAYQLAS